MVANLPFLTVVNLIGIDVFVESFQHPDSFQYSTTFDPNGDARTEGYLILEAPTDQNFLIQTGDTILYRTGQGAVGCESVQKVAFRQDAMIYFINTPEADDNTSIIYGTQILGKVICHTDDNIWNALCLHIWDFSKNNLNANAFLGNI